MYTCMFHHQQHDKLTTSPGTSVQILLESPCNTNLYLVSQVKGMLKITSMYRDNSFDIVDNSINLEKFKWKESTETRGLYIYSL